MRSIRSVCFYLLLVACMSTMVYADPLFRNFGRITPSHETTRAFESYTVKTDFRYYFSGSDVYPNAIIGLHRDYRIDPKSLWKPVEMTPETMMEIVKSMNKKAFESLSSLYGFELLDPKGRPIGVWYSILTARTCLQMKDDGTVRIDTPDLDTYEQLNREMGVHLESG